MKKIICFLSIFILVSEMASGQTTYTWIGVNNASWAVSTNWSPTRTAPATNNILQFNDGTTKTITAVPTQTIGQFVMSGNTTITLQSSSTQTLAIGNETGTDLVIPTGSALTLGTNTNITLATSATADISGTLTVNTGRSYNTNGTSVVTTVNGTIVNVGTVTNSTSSKLLFNSGSIYQHSQDGGVIPTATWDANSTCLLTGTVGTIPTGLGQTFGHLTWNCASQTDNSTPPTNYYIQGNLTVQNTNTGQFRIGNGTNTVLGDYSQSNGSVRVAGINSRTLNISGNFSLSNGTLYMSEGNTLGTVNIAGNFFHTGGQITENSTGSGAINFTRAGIQTYTSGGIVTNTINFTVNSGSTLQMAAAGTVITGGGSFTLSSGATLGITSTAGITSSGATGNIQVTGTRIFNTGANYIYNGTSAQSIGAGFPTNLTGNLTINNNGNTVTLNNARTIANLGSINLTAGTFAAGTNLSMATTSLITRSEGSMTGTLQGAGTYNVTFTGNSKSTGSELSGTGLSNVSTNLNSGQSLTLDQSKTVTGSLTLKSGNITTGLNTLTIGSTGTVSRIDGHIIGSLKKNSFTGNKTFEVGTLVGYTPVNLVATGTGDFTVRSVSGPHPNATGTNILQMYWTLTNGGITSADLTFNYLDADVVGDEAQYELGRYNGNWAFLSPITLNTTANTVSINGINSFSDFTLGEPNALPVELTSFSATSGGSNVKLSWSTATEVNNYGFDIERSKKQDAGGGTWEKLGFVNGNGNSNSPKSYSFVDNKVNVGKYSYRLKQIDNDGQFEYSKVIEVDLGSPKKFELSQNYPNPFNPTTTIRFNLPEASMVKLTLFNILGQEVRTLVNEFKESGVHTINFDGSELNSGIYIYKLEAGSYTQTRKMTLGK